MSSESDKRRKPRRRSLRAQPELTVVLPQESGSQKEIRARLLDISDTGIGLELPVSLVIGSNVTVAGIIQNALGVSSVRTPARVCWCATVHPDLHRVGLIFESAKPHPAPEPPAVDYYEVLQLSPKADLDTIHRVFRILAQRSHPDNQETGDASAFREIMDAYRVLSDPERRASYDAALESNRRGRLKIFEDWEASTGIEAEQRKREGVLSALYTQRCSDPHQPVMSMRELEDILGCPKEHLEFVMWYLKESGHIIRSDNNRFAITVKGVDEFEACHERRGHRHERLKLAPVSRA